MIALLSVAWALPDCPTEATASLANVREALEAIEPTLRAIVPELPTVDRTPHGFARDDGMWFAVGAGFPATCRSEGRDVAETPRWPIPGSGSFSRFTLAKIPPFDVLMMGFFDPDRGDRVAWESILAHEWFHLVQANALGDRFHGVPDRRRITKRFAGGGKFRDAVTQLGQAIDLDCATDLVAPWDTHLEALPGKLRADAEEYVRIEGFARFVELRYEGAARGWDDDPAERAAGATPSTAVSTATPSAA